ncbi:type IV secretion protein Rhs [Chryseobacterium sp. T16E-39]|uniref:RHS repeat domain-containing protein n=1 Tax=Chryseobacterium sp. T16E-39 TaxID=2015076 RepID=UPI000B5B17BB|nr:RHS repeat-associated core domain-containing protein [Chryseobacterium sp. T16E-39]ASK31573.1 type IV secretion protein Rhs [Chryseobacterium sp. T16E-39]
MKILSAIILSLSSVWGYSQTREQKESISRTAQHQQSSVLAKTGSVTEDPGGGPSDSGAGANNPSGTFAPQNESFYNTKGNIDVTASGQLQFNLPIALPPGIKDVAPSLNLSYLSGSGNGIAGYGWSISGITTITRAGKSIEKDGESKAMQLDYSDYYSFNGQRLILKSGQYGKDGAEYVTEKYSNVKIKSLGSVYAQPWQGPEYWEITFEDGSQAWYGATTTGNSTARTPIEYNIVKWRDKKGNYISYNYTQSSSIALINNIQWGGNEDVGKPHFNRVDFHYSSRNIPESSYLKGIGFIQYSILSTITVYTESTIFKSYTINYSTSEKINDDSNRLVNYQFVKSVTEGNSINDPANPVLFAAKPLKTKVDEYGFGDYSDVITTGDYNGDSLVDFVVKQPAQSGRPEGYYIYFDVFNNTSPNYVYLGSSATYQAGKLLNFNIKPSDNIVKTKQGLLFIKALPVDDHTTGNIDLKYYSIKTDGSVLNTLNNPLITEYSKTVNPTAYVYPTNFYPLNNIPANYGISDFSQLEDPKEVDINLDGMSELIFAIKDSRCFRSQTTLTWSCNHLGYRYAVVDDADIASGDIHIISNANTQVNKSILSKSGIMDFDNNGKTDIIFAESASQNTNVSFSTKNYVFDYYPPIVRNISTPLNNLRQYELVKGGNSYYISLKKTHTVKGLLDGIQYGDLNGDRNMEVLIPLHENATNDDYQTGWAIYLNDGLGLNESLQGLMYYRSSTSASTGLVNYSNTSLIDLDGDGKSDIVNSIVTHAPALQLSTWRIDSYGEAQYNIGDPEFRWKFNAQRLYYSERPKYVVSPLFGDFKINNSTSKVLFLLKGIDSGERKLISYQHFNLNNDKNISTISQANLIYNIDYKELDPVINPNMYAPIKKEQYPYVEMDRLSQTFAVTQIRLFNRKQDFRYRGHIAHLQGRGVVGFRQVARSSWYADGFENTKIWSGTEIDPLKEALPVKEWSIRTNDENKIFPTDLSINNTQLLSFKSTDYKIDKLLDGQVVSTVPDIDRSRAVTAIVPSSNLSKDFLNNTTTNTSVTYGNLYLPSVITTTVNGNFSTSTKKFGYFNNPTGQGKDYYIGRLSAKIEEKKAYSSTHLMAEYYTYENNLLKTNTTIAGTDFDNAIVDEFTYDGFGNLTEKLTRTGYNTTTRIQKNVYDPKGKFLIKQIDNLGLVTDITYNNWGQVISKTDPSGNSIVSTYNEWGTLMKVKSNLSGSTSYQHIRDTNGNITVVQYDADGNISRKFTNALGQEYKTHTKGFNAGTFIATYTFYDAIGRKIRESEPFVDMATEEPQFPVTLRWNVINYDDTVFPSKITATALAKLDSQWQVSTFIGKKVETSVSGLTTTVREINGYNRTSSKTADALGNIISSTDPGGIINFLYNADGQQIQAKYGDNIVTTKYDAWGRKIELNDPSNGLYKYEYNGFSQPVKLISPKGTKEYSYNNLSQLISQTEISTADNGQATNKTITYTYDDKGRLTLRSGTSKGKGFSSNVVYDPQGRVLSTSENSNGKYFTQKGITYDDKARVISYEKSINSSGLLTKVNVENVYNTWNGELYQIKDKNSGKILWTLLETNLKGQTLKANLGKSKIFNTYDESGYLTNIDHQHWTQQAGIPSILFVNYTFDGVKNELKTRNTLGDFSISETFTYDDNNRLIKWTNPRTGQLSQNIYDAKGRILENDQIGTMKYENTSKVYQPTGMTLNNTGVQNYNNDLIQSIVYNENNDPVFIDGEKGDVAFQYGLTSMRQQVTYGGNFGSNGEGKFTKYYSEDGSFEVVRENATGKEKHILYIGGTPYESNIIFLKNYDEASGSYKFLHKDYIGSILAISDEDGNKLEQRHYDAWGNFTHLKIGNGAVVTDKNIIDNASLLLDRGYTSHEHFAEVGIIHMNGRLYDPLLRRFLNADENIQDPTNTQNYNKYGYVMNNPLMFNDPNGEFFIAISIPILIIGALKAVMIGALIYTGMAALTGNASKAGFLKSVLTSFVMGGLSAGVGALNVFGNGFWGTVAQGAALGAAGGAIDAAVNNTNVLQGIVKGAAMGGAIAAVSYTVRYYTTSTGTKTSAIEDTAENTVDGKTPVGDRSYARDLYEKQFGTQSGLDKNDIYNRAIPGGEMTCDCSEGVIKYTEVKESGEKVVKRALGVTESTTVDRGFLKGKVNVHKIYLSHKAFASREQLAYVMQHELGHVRIYNGGEDLRKAAKKEIQLSGSALDYSSLLDNAGHYHIQQYGTSFLENNGWNLKSAIPSNIFNSANFKMYNQSIYNALKNTDFKININFK